MTLFLLFRNRKLLALVAVIACCIPVALVGLLAAVLSGNASGSQDSQSGAACLNVPTVGISAQSAGSLSQLQVSNAGAIIAAGVAMNIPPRGQIIAVAVADEESRLMRLANTNVPESMSLPHDGVGHDHTSVGLFQQLNSWGSAQQRLDATWSAQQFYTHLLRVPNWQSLPLTVAAQTVQVSAFPNAYAPYEPVATQLVTGASVSGGTVQAAACAGPNGTGSALPVSGVVAQVLAFARSKIGLPYQWGGTGNPSYDCSGLAQAAYASAGISLPRTTSQQINVGTPVARDQLRPGDLVFPDPGHVQIYSGNGNIIEAPTTGELLREVPMWGFWQARRIIQ